MDGWPAQQDAAPHLTSRRRDLNLNDSVEHGYPGALTPSRQNASRNLEKRNAGRDQHGATLRGGPNRVRAALSSNESAISAPSIPSRRRRPKPSPGRARPTTNPNPSWNNDNSTDGMPHHPLQSRRETDGAGPADTGYQTYHQPGVHPAVGFGPPGSSVALSPPGYPAREPLHHPNSQEIPSPPPPITPENRHQGHDIAAALYHGVSHPPSAPAVPPAHPRTSHADALRAGVAAVSGAGTHPARGFLDRDSPARGGHNSTTEAVGFAETQAFREQQHVDGGASKMADESIAGFEPQYAQPDTVRAAVSGGGGGRFSAGAGATSTPRAGAGAGAARSHPQPHEVVGDYSSAAIHERLQQQLFDRGRVASADHAQYPNRQYEDINIRPRPSHLHPHQQHRPDHNQSFGSSHLDQTIPLQTPNTPQAFSHLQPRNGDGFDPPPPPHQHIPQHRTNQYNEHANGFAMEHTAFPEISVPTLDDTFNKPSMPEGGAGVHGWCRFVPNDPTITGWRVRVAPNASTTTIGLLAVGDRFKVLQEYNEWVKIFDVESCPLLSGWTLRYSGNSEVIVKESEIIDMEKELDKEYVLDDVITLGLSAIQRETQPLLNFCKSIWGKAKRGAVMAKCSVVAAVDKGRKKKNPSRDPLGLGRMEEESIDTISVVLPKARKQSMLGLGLHFAKIPDIPYTMLALQCTIGGTAAGRCKDLRAGQILVTIGQTMVLGLNHGEVVRIIANVSSPYIVLGMAEVDAVVPHLPRLFELDDAVQETKHLHEQRELEQQNAEFEQMQQQHDLQMQQQQHELEMQQQQHQMQLQRQQQMQQLGPDGIPVGLSRLERQRYMLQKYRNALEHQEQQRQQEQEQQMNEANHETSTPNRSLHNSQLNDSYDEQATPQRQVGQVGQNDNDLLVTPENVGRFSSVYNTSPERATIPPLPPHLQPEPDTAGAGTPPLQPDLAAPPPNTPQAREWEGKGTARVQYERTPESSQHVRQWQSHSPLSSQSQSHPGLYTEATTPDRPTQQKVAVPSIRYEPTIGHIGRQLFDPVGDDGTFVEPTRKEVRSGYALFRRPKSEIPVPGSAQSGSIRL